MEKLTYKSGCEKYGFVLFSAKFGSRWDKVKEEDHIFISSSDFEYIIESVKSIYPFTDPETEEIQEYFDVCGMNCIPVMEWNKILNNLQKKAYKDTELKRFIDKFSTLIQNRIKESEEIMIWGTL